MKAKEIFLLIFIILIGVFITQVYTGEFHFDLGWGDRFLFGYEKFVFEETEMIESPLPEELRIRNSHGSIEILGSDEENITITFEKRIWRKNESEAQEAAKQLKMFAELEDQALKISTNRQEFRRKNIETHFVIRVPEGMNVTVVNSYGLVRTERVGHTDITNPYGEVFASDIRGTLVVSNRYEDIEIEQVESAVRIPDPVFHAIIRRLPEFGMVIGGHNQFFGPAEITHRLRRRGNTQGAFMITCPQIMGVFRDD